jgi:hypothetical protein
MDQNSVIPNPFTNWPPAIISKLCNSGLPKDLIQLNDRHGAGGDNVLQHISRADGRKLIDIPDHDKRGIQGDRFQEMVHQNAVHHRKLIHNEQVTIDRGLLIVDEVSKGIRTFLSLLQKSFSPFDISGRTDFSAVIC